MVALLIDGATTRWAQPIRSATRFRRGPTAGNICKDSSRPAAGNRAGAKVNIADSRPLNSRANGRANPAARRAQRKRAGYGSSIARMRRSVRSRNGRR